MTAVLKPEPAAPHTLLSHQSVDVSLHLERRLLFQLLSARGATMVAL